MIKKKTTLFVYSNNIETWLWNNNQIPDNIDQIIIFCVSSGEKQYYHDWTRRYTQKVTDVITWNELERELLIHGLTFIGKLCSNFQENPQLLELLQQQQERIRLALIQLLDQLAQ